MKKRKKGEVTINYGRKRLDGKGLIDVRLDSLQNPIK
jgi:hypothetical protein